MSFEQSTAAGMHDLLDKLKTFLENDSWTINEHASDSQNYQARTGLTTAGSKRLHVQKDLGPSGDVMTCYFNFRSCERLFLFEESNRGSSTVNGRYWGETRGIGVNGSTGYDSSSAGSNWDKQPGAPEAGSTGEAIGGAMNELSTTSIPYWFFSIGDSVYVVAQETRTGFYQHMAFGRLGGKGGYTGGMYYSCSSVAFQPSYAYWTSTAWAYRVCYMSDLAGSIEGATGIYLTENGDADWRHAGMEGNINTDYARYVWPGGLQPYISDPTNSQLYGHSSAMIIARTPNTVNALSPMMKSHWYCKNVGGRFFFCGYPEGFRYINRTGFNPGDSFVLGDSGGDEWFVFPHHSSLDEDPYNSVALKPYFGVAYKKVV